MTRDPTPDDDETTTLPVETPDPTSDPAEEIEERGAPFDGDFA